MTPIAASHFLIDSMSAVGNSWALMVIIVLGGFAANPANSLIPIAEGLGLAAFLHWMSGAVTVASFEIQSAVTLASIVWITSFIVMLINSLMAHGWRGWPNFSVIEVSKMSKNLIKRLRTSHNTTT